MTSEDAQRVLGVTSTTSPHDLKKRWRKLVMRHHPDRGGDPALFRAVNDAYTLLKTMTPHTTPESARTTACDSCGGRGYVEIHFGFTTIQLSCVACRRA